MIDTKAFSSEALPDYYNRLAQRLEGCSCFRIALANKAAAGSARSEKGYQILAVSTARGIAEGLYRYIRSDGGETKGETK